MIISFKPFFFAYLPAKVRFKVKKEDRNKQDIFFQIADGLRFLNKSFKKLFVHFSHSQR